MCRAAIYAQPRGAGFPISLCDLTQCPPEGVDWSDYEAVVHLANHSDAQRAPRERLLAENALRLSFGWAQGLTQTPSVPTRSAKGQVFPPSLAAPTNKKPSAMARPAWSSS